MSTSAAKAAEKRRRSILKDYLACREPLRVIGERYGIGHEWVRRIAVNAGPPSRGSVDLRKRPSAQPKPPRDPHGIGDMALRVRCPCRPWQAARDHRAAVPREGRRHRSVPAWILGIRATEPAATTTTAAGAPSAAGLPATSGTASARRGGPTPRAPPSARARYLRLQQRAGLPLAHIVEQ